ncbi:efflux RND transporter periplasmic adaptor subunit [Roseateles koreensis]|uniref:Efflux RND transporter periplasmic adaptor subunit n=1 Tax=Roseateles koreensis TaxID=2987526 RepID=A0ABT5KQ29_9BURK|nr:efflux RND transporter periplasmic adaptor subunit [Roseateles koreensis]MDC8785027.1 efflux RND transporter periplasmic adaptor subunit [Roseateles koreensis]
MRRKSIAAGLVLVALATGAWFQISSSRKDKALTAQNAAPNAKPGSAMAVGVVTARLQDVPITLEATGTVTALKTVDLRAQTTNIVTQVLIKEGDDVARGQLLFRFDDRTDRANLAKARAQLARDRATQADLERQYQRARDLLAQHFVAQGAVDTALANLEAQRALVASDAAAVQAAEVALSFDEVRAPLSGRTGIISVVAGSLVQGAATAPALVTISQISPIAISFTLPETQLAQVLQAQTQGPRQAPVVATVPGAQAVSERLNGRLSFVDNLVDSSTGTIRLKAEFDNAQHKLWPGQYVQLRLQLHTLKNVVTIPLAAIIQRGNERSVYIAEGSPATAKLVPVTIRHVFGEIAVVDGLAANAQVVLDGKQNLRPGVPLTLQAAAVNPAAAAASAAASVATSGSPT